MIDPTLMPPHPREGWHYAGMWSDRGIEIRADDPDRMLGWMAHEVGHLIVAVSARLGEDHRATGRAVREALRLIHAPSMPTGYDQHDEDGWLAPGATAALYPLDPVPPEPTP